MSTEERGRTSYVDLLISTLTEHEKTLSRLIDRLEKVEGLLAEEAGAKAAALGSDTLVYMKVKLNRPVDEAVKIIESLKE
jgi:hypothetical protein